MTKESAITTCILLLVICIGLIFLISQQEWQFKENVSSSMTDIVKIKSDCEKSLPRDQECVMVFDFVPVKKEKSE